MSHTKNLDLEQKLMENWRNHQMKDKLSTHIQKYVLPTFDGEN